MGVSNMLKRIDFLGGDINFYHRNFNKLKTNFGGFMSILISFLFALLILGFGQDFFERKNPAFVKSSISLNQIPVYSINNNNLSLAFRLENIDNELYNHEENFEIIPSYLLFIKNNETGLLDIKEIPISIVPCNKKYFTLDLSLDGLKCVNFNNTLLGGSLSQGYWGLLEIFIKNCKEGEYSSTGKQCSSTDHKRKELDGSIYFTVYIQKSIVNPDDYHGGLKSRVKSEQFRLNAHLYNYMELFLSESVMDTDYGWLLTDVSSTRLLGLTSINDNYSYFANLLTNNSAGFIGAFSLNFIPELDKYYRKYPKAQELAAQVGGILKIFLEVGYIMVGAFSLNHCQLDLSEYLMNKNDSEQLSFNSSVIKNNTKNDSPTPEHKNATKVNPNFMNLAEKSNMTVNRLELSESNYLGNNNKSEVKLNNLINKPRPLDNSSYAIKNVTSNNNNTDSLKNNKQSTINIKDKINRKSLNENELKLVNEQDIKVGINYQIQLLILGKNCY